MRVMLVTGYYPGARVGGAEYQTSLLAQGLSARGHEVTFLAAAADQDSVAEENGFTIRQIPGWRVNGWSEHRRQTAEVIEETMPGICYVRALTELASVSAQCRQAGIPVVSASSSLREVSPFLLGYYPVETIAHLRAGRTLPHFRSFLAIRSSTAHVCNTIALRESIRRWYPRKPIQMIYNGQPAPPGDKVHQATTGQIIWVNNLKRRKRPQLFVELARRLPEYRFLMVGAMPSGGSYAQKLKRMMQDSPDNLEYLGALPLDEVNELILQSDLLLYTSKAGSEGFGNSFLQAWHRGVPTVSLSCELDGILEREGIGCFCEGFDQLVANVRELMQDEETRLAMGRRAREYAVRQHTTDRMVSDFEVLFEGAVGGSLATRPVAAVS